MSTDIDMIADLRAELVSVRAAKATTLTNGQEHSLNGSHSFKGVSYGQLLRREASILAQLALLNGIAPFTVAAFSGSNDVNRIPS